MILQDNINRLKRLLKESHRITVFTGAGISTESGIPDFRSPGGLWTKHKPIQFQDFITSAEKRKESWRIKLKLDSMLATATPNKGHKALVTLFESGRLSSVITQNIDGLHQASGIPDDRVIELHGNTTYAACLDCKKRYELDVIKKIFDVDETLPVCDDCGGMIKTATISFGQAMPEEEMKKAEKETLDCDLFLAIGSSLVVYPAAGFPIMAKQNGAKLVIINRDETPLDEIADLVINSEIGETLSEAVKM
ncbi:Sir2 family NAD-dependent protein deacetylase [bacterium]|nr:Sir2 family NAD-dependent protein deacetylase [bacterium]